MAKYRKLSRTSSQRKALITLLLVITIFGIFSCTNKIYAAQQVLDNRVEGQLNLKIIKRRKKQILMKKI